MPVRSPLVLGRVAPALSRAVAGRRQGPPSGENGSDATSPTPAGVGIFCTLHPIRNLEQETLQ